MQVRLDYIYRNCFLLKSHDITLIDNNQINLKDGENYLDIKVINGDSSSRKL